MITIPPSSFATPTTAAIASNDENAPPNPTTPTIAHQRAAPTTIPLQQLNTNVPNDVITLQQLQALQDKASKKRHY